MFTILVLVVLLLLAKTEIVIISIIMIFTHTIHRDMKFLLSPIPNSGMFFYSHSIILEP